MTAPITEDAPKDTARPDKPSPATPLTLQDRCDRCGAQAFVRASILAEPGPTDLLFCGHHFTMHETKLREVALSVQDERHRINEKPSQSSSS